MTYFEYFVLIVCVLVLAVVATHKGEDEPSPKYILIVPMDNCPVIEESIPNPEIEI